VHAHVQSKQTILLDAKLNEPLYKIQNEVPYLNTLSEFIETALKMPTAPINNKVNLNFKKFREIKKNFR